MHSLASRGHMDGSESRTDGHYAWVIERSMPMRTFVAVMSELQRDPPSKPLVRWSFHKACH